jgi:aspartate ammonia-lyase
VARKAQETGGRVYDIVLEENLMDKETLDNLLSPANMVYPKVKLTP